MSNGKVTLSKEVAEAIESYVSKFGKKSIILVAFDPSDEFVAEYRVLNDIDAEIIGWALYVGYIVAQSPEERLREYYLEAVRDAESDDWDDRPFGLERSDTILTVLDILGIPIDGINVDLAGGDNDV
jgi:hypothetical protein